LANAGFNTNLVWAETACTLLLLLLLLLLRHERLKPLLTA
jgi:hypothetical protein